jgi:uncharacterized protein DUF3558
LESLVRSRFAAVAAALAVVTVTIGGCTSTEAGSPLTETPGGTSGPPPGTITTQQPGQPTVAIPPRPKALPLDNVEPCSLIDSNGLKQLQVTEEPTSRTSTDVYKAKQCMLNVVLDDKDYSYFVSAITTEGIGAWLDGQRVVEAKLVSVEGYAAVDYYAKGTGPSNGNGGCATSVDVADGQQLDVAMQPFGKTGLSQDQQCQMTEQAAALAVSTLQSTR